MPGIHGWIKPAVNLHPVQYYALYVLTFQSFVSQMIDCGQILTQFSSYRY